MELLLKDLLYIGGMLATIVGSWVANKFRVSNVEKRQDNIEKVLYDNETGTLSLVTKTECVNNRKEVKTEITDFKKEIRGIERELRKLSEYVLIIMVNLDIDPDKIKNRRKN